MRYCEKDRRCESNYRFVHGSNQEPAILQGLGSVSKLCRPWREQPGNNQGIGGSQNHVRQNDRWDPMGKRSMEDAKEAGEDVLNLLNIQSCYDCTYWDRPWNKAIVFAFDGPVYHSAFTLSSSYLVPIVFLDLYIIVLPPHTYPISFLIAFYALLPKVPYILF